MEKTRKYFNLLLMLLIGLAFSACSNDNEGGKSEKFYGENKAKIIRQEIISAEEMCNRIFGSDGSNSDEDNAELRELFMQKIHEKEAALEEKYGANGIYMGFSSCEYSYESVDQHGNSIRLSALVSWAKYWLFGWHDLDPDNIYLVEHYTVLSDAECPTNSCSTEQIALGDNLLIMPDYLGYGETKDLLHPYLNHELCAINSVNALNAGYAVFQIAKESSTKLEDDWKMYVLGCSQGGANALAVHKYLDTHPDLASKWRFAYSYCCAGPYSPRKTLEYYYEHETLTYPVILPMVIKSMLDSYPDILGKWKEEDFYCEKYLAVKSTMDKLISEKENTSEQLIAKLKGLLNCDTVKISDILSKNALNKESEMTKAFFQCLDKNDLTKGWTPTHEIKLYHSKDDDIVPYSNAEAVVNAFPNKTNLFHSLASGHVFTCKKWYGTLGTNNW